MSQSLLTIFLSALLLNFSLYAGMPLGAVPRFSPDPLPTARFLGVAKSPVQIALAEDSSIVGEYAAQVVVSPASEKVRLEVRRGGPSGALVASLGSGQKIGQNLVARWNLKDSQGRLVDAGKYTLVAFAKVETSPVLAQVDIDVVVQKGLFPGLPVGEVSGQPIRFALGGHPPKSGQASAPLAKDFSVTLLGSESRSLSNSGAPLYLEAPEGAGKYRFEANFEGGVRYAGERSFILDTSAPVIVFSGISNKQIEVDHKTTSVVISGKVVEDRLSLLTMAGRAVTVNAGGAFVATAATRPGDRSIEVVAVDRAGNRTAEIIKLKHLGEGPSLTVNVPEGFITSDETLAFDLATEGATSLFINGVPRVLRGPAYRFTAGLEQGPNNFTFRVTDDSGREAVITRTVVYQKEGPRPVAGFKAFQVHGGVELSWGAATDESVAYYTLRRDPGFPVGMGNGAGTVKVFGKSGYLDISAQSDFLYTYYLGAVDIWGRSGVEVPVKLGTMGASEVVAVAGQESRLSFDRLSLRIKAESLRRGTHQTIKAGWVKRDLGESGVEPLGEVYQLGPSGLRFEKPIEATVSYNPSAIPGGYGEGEVQIFLRNGPGAPWELCPRVSLDTSAHTVTALVGHFSEIVAGFVAAPTQSQTRFNVNTKLPEMKIPDPLSGRTRIALPGPNAGGSLGQSIDIPLPPGVDGLTPSVSLQYDSGRGNGLCGIGWAMPADGISRDLKKGIPKYDTSDTFLYNGQELVYMNGSGSEGDPRIYRLKREGSFLKFQFFTNENGANGVWKIVQNGVTYNFGASGVGEVSGRSLTGTAGTFRWNLRLKSKGDQSVSYDYLPMGGNRNELASVSYLAQGGQYKFQVRFDYQDRSDTLHSAATGVHTTLSKVLSGVSVWERTTSDVFHLVESWNLRYQPNQGGDLRLTQLEKILGGSVLEMTGTYAYGTGCEVFFQGSTLYFRNEWGDLTTAAMLDGRRASVWGMVASNALDGSGIYWLNQQNENQIQGKWDRVSLSAHRFLGTYFDAGESAQVIWTNGQLTFVNHTGYTGVGEVLDDHQARCITWGNMVAHREADGSKLTWRDSAGADTGTPWTRQGAYLYSGSTGVLETTTFTYGDLNYQFAAETTWNPQGLGSGAAGNGVPYESFRRKMMDFDGDGLTDVLIDLEGHGDESPTQRFRLFRNNGSTWVDAGFLGVNHTPYGFSSSRIQFTALDRDGRPDILYDATGLSTETGTHFVLYKNTPTGFVRQNTDFTLQAERSRVSLGDLSGAGLPSVVVSLYGSESYFDKPGYQVYTNNGDVFEASPLIFAPEFTVRTEYTALQDFNGDGKPDFVVDKSATGGAQFSVYYNDGTQFLSIEHVYRVTGDLVFRRMLQDMNGDGKVDLVINQNGVNDGHFTVYLNLDGDFDLEHPMDMAGPVVDASRLSFNDVNNDGRPDILVDLTGIGNDGDTEIWLNNRTGFFKLPQAFNSGYPVGAEHFFRLSRADLDGDGRLDFISVNDGRDGYADGVYSFLKRQGDNNNLLTSVTSAGMTATFTYGRVNAGLGYAQNVLTGYTVKNGFSPEHPDYWQQSATFDYDRGLVDREKGIGYGFGLVTATDGAGNRTSTAFHTGSEQLQGLVAAEIKEVKRADQSVVPVSMKTNWYHVAQANGVSSYLPLLTQVETTAYHLGYSEHPADPRYFQVNRVGYFYYGVHDIGIALPSGAVDYYPLGRKINYQQVAPGGGDLHGEDNLIEEYSYTSPGENGRNPVPFATKKFNGLGDIAGITTNYYDGETAGVLGNSGLLTQKATWNGVLEGDHKFLTNTYTYDTAGHLLIETDPKGVSSTNIWDATGRFITASSTSLGDSSAKNNDPVWGLRLSETDNFGRVTSFAYDHLRRLSAVFSPGDEVDKPSLSYEFGDNGDGAFYAVLKHRKFQNNGGLAGGEPPCIESIGFVDGLGRELSSRVWKSATEYVASGRRIYDVMGQVTAQYDPVAVNAAEVPFRVYAPVAQSAYRTDVTYDALGRKTAVTRGASTNATAFVDLYTTETTDPRGLVKRSIKNPYGQVVTNQDVVAGSVYASIHYLFDLRGNLTNTQDIAGNNIRLLYNELGQKTNMVDPDMGTWSYWYDGWGQMTNQRDARLVDTRFTYNERGNLTNKRFSDGWSPEIDYTYGSDVSLYNRNRLVLTEDGPGYTTNTYDADGVVTNVRRVVDGQIFDTGYFYDNLGRIRDLVYPHAPEAPEFRVHYTYDGHSGLLSRVARVIEGLPDEVFLNGIAYDSMGRRGAMTFGNLVETSYNYNPQTSMLSAMTVAKSGGLTYSQIGYTFDNGGLLTQKTEAVGDRGNTYEYDDLGRLIQETHYTNGVVDEAYNHHFGYDALGNIRFKEGNNNSIPTSGNRAYTYSSDRPHAVIQMMGEYNKGGAYDPNALYNYDYDAMGNMVHTVVQGAGFITGHTHYNFDGEGHLVRTLTNKEGDLNATLVYQYAYDASGERVKKERVAGENPQATLYVEGMLQAQVQSGVVGALTYLIFDGVNRIAAVNEVSGVKKTFFMHTDHVGSTTLVTTGSGDEWQLKSAARTRYEYKAFGAVFAMWHNDSVDENGGGWLSGAIGSALAEIGNYTFTGQEQDESGLIYYGARYYDPGLGRFISGDSSVTDPGNSQCYGRYTYCVNNPIVYTDPSGHDYEDWYSDTSIDDWYWEYSTEEVAEEGAPEPVSGSGTTRVAQVSDSPLIFRSSGVIYDGNNASIGDYRCVTTYNSDGTLKNIFASSEYRSGKELIMSTSEWAIYQDDGMIGYARMINGEVTEDYGDVFEKMGLKSLSSLGQFADSAQRIIDSGTVGMAQFAIQSASLAGVGDNVGPSTASSLYQAQLQNVLGGNYTVSFNQGTEDIYIQQFQDGAVTGRVKIEFSKEGIDKTQDSTPPYDLALYKNLLAFSNFLGGKEVIIMSGNRAKSPNNDASVDWKTSLHNDANGHGGTADIRVDGIDNYAALFILANLFDIENGGGTYKGILYEGEGHFLHVDMGSVEQNLGRREAILRDAGVYESISAQDWKNIWKEADKYFITLNSHPFKNLKNLNLEGRRDLFK